MSDIAELFARDPLRHKDADIDAIILHFRTSRVNFKANGSKVAPKLPKKLAEAEKVKDALGLSVDIGDL